MTKMYKTYLGSIEFQAREYGKPETECDFWFAVDEFLDWYPPYFDITDNSGCYFGGTDEVAFYAFDDNDDFYMDEVEVDIDGLTQLTRDYIARALARAWECETFYCN